MTQKGQDRKKMITPAAKEITKALDFLESRQMAEENKGIYTATDLKMHLTNDVPLILRGSHQLAG